MKLKEQFFDFEVFPDWWCCVVGRYPNDDNIPESIKEEFIAIRSDRPCAREDLMALMCDKECVNFGYNNKRYDNIILNGVVNGFTPRQLKILSDIIIDPEVQYSSHEAMRIAPFARKRYQNFVFQDMLDDNTGSLKEKESCMQLDIRESTVDFNKENLTEQEKEEVIDYCRHDVWSGMQFYKQVLKSFVATKLLVGKVFDIPAEACYKSTNAQISGRALGAKRTSWPDSKREDIDIPKELQQYIHYSLPKEVVARLCASGDKFNYKLFGNTVSYSNGGIHSIPIKNLQVKSGDGWKLINVDAASFYPAIMIFWKTLSRAVSRPDMFKDMYETRLRFKREGNKSQEALDTSQAYKLILNTTFGASGNKWLDLYDPYMTTKTCRLGQLLLTSLANNIYNQIGKDKIQVVQTNTDGVLVYIQEDMVPMLHRIGDEWTKVTNILLEYEDEEITWQRDVNNYILYKQSGAIKSKGGYFVTDMIQPGYNRVRPLNTYVCRDAVKEYLKHGTDIVEYIYNEQDISKFIVTCHKGSFSGIVRAFNDGRPDEILHKVNRTYASLDKSLGMVYKLKRFKGEMRKYKAPDCPPHCELLNKDLSKYDINTLREDIDYMWYIENTINMLSDQWYEMKGNRIVPIKLFEI